MRVRRRGMAVVLALLSFLLLYAFAATNSVPDTLAGDGEGLVNGYTVTNVTYILDTNDLSQIAGVQFDLSAGATTVYAALWDGTTWNWSAACTNTAGNTWSCTFSPSVPVQPVTKLRVVAAQ